MKLVCNFCGANAEEEEIYRIERKPNSESDFIEIFSLCRKCLIEILKNSFKVYEIELIKNR